MSGIKGVSPRSCVIPRDPPSTGRHTGGLKVGWSEIRARRRRVRQTSTHPREREICTEFGQRPGRREMWNENGGKPMPRASIHEKEKRMNPSRTFVVHFACRLKPPPPTADSQSRKNPTVVQPARRAWHGTAYKPQLPFAAVCLTERLGRTHKPTRRHMVPTNRQGEATELLRVKRQPGQ